LELMANELSLHGQFNDIPSFKGAVGHVMKIRDVAKRFGREIYCHRNFSHSIVMPDTPLRQAIQAFSFDERRAFLNWITQHGPFWEDWRVHGPDEYLAHEDEIVTDSSLGEAAWCTLNGTERQIVSFAPSSWLSSPLEIIWTPSSGEARLISVPNYWDADVFERALQAIGPDVSSWDQVATISKARFVNLTFAENAFSPLAGHPFVLAAAKRILFILEKLDEFKTCFDENGVRTEAGHEIYQEFFTGKKGDGGRGPIFSDSSDSEKDDFKKELTFPCPSDLNTNIFCTWHGKVQTPQFRVHFSWPVRASEPLYLVYVGEKLTKR
jgi:hypothetical protein